MRETGWDRDNGWCVEDVREYFGEYMREGIEDETIEKLMDYVEDNWEEWRADACMPSMNVSSFTHKMNMFRWFMITVLKIEGVPFKARYLRAEYLNKEGK